MKIFQCRSESRGQKRAKIFWSCRLEILEVHWENLQAKSNLRRPDLYLIFSRLFLRPWLSSYFNISWPELQPPALPAPTDGRRNVSPSCGRGQCDHPSGQRLQKRICDCAVTGLRYAIQLLAWTRSQLTLIGSAGIAELLVFHPVRRMYIQKKRRNKSDDV